MKTLNKPIRWFICIALIVASFAFLTGCSSKTEYAAFPFVAIEDLIFLIDTQGVVTTELSDAYALIGEVANRTNNRTKNGDSSCCNVGDKIYQSVHSPDEIYVYTKLFSGNNEYRYLRFIKS